MSAARLRCGFGLRPIGAWIDTEFELGESGVGGTASIFERHPAGIAEAFTARLACESILDHEAPGAAAQPQSEAWEFVVPEDEISSAVWRRQWPW